MKKTIQYLTIVLLVGLSAYYLLPINRKVEEPKGTPQVNNSTDLGVPGLGFSFNLPKTYTVENNGQFSRLYSKKSSTPGVGPENFIYISIIPQGKEVEEGEIYNYSQNALQALNKLQIGQSAQINNVSDPVLLSYYKYTRIDDVMIGGYGAKAFKNEKPWEFPNGTTEYRYVVPFTQATFLIGGYTATDNQITSNITKSEMDSVLQNLKLTPETITLVFTSPIPEKDWVKFSDSQSGISFEYPSGWTVHNDSQNFPEGDLLSLTAIGQSQRPQTELYDGVSFSVMKPFSFTGNASEWVKTRYEKSELNPDRKPEFSRSTFGGKVYEKAIVCGLGCFTHYYTVQKNKMYGFVVNAVGPHKTAYESAVSRILSSVDYY